MKQARMVMPGDPAKNFSLKDQNDKTFDLFEQDGKRTHLSSVLHTKSLKIFPLPGEMGSKTVRYGIGDWDKIPKCQYRKPTIVKKEPECG